MFRPRAPGPTTAPHVISVPAAVANDFVRALAALALVLAFVLALAAVLGLATVLALLAAHGTRQDDRQPAGQMKLPQFLMKLPAACKPQGSAHKSHKIKLGRLATISKDVDVAGRALTGLPDTMTETPDRSAIQQLNIPDRQTHATQATTDSTACNC